MKNVQYTLVGTEDGSNISVFIPGYAPQVAHSSHPNFDAILNGVLANDDSVIDLFDVAATVAKRFDRLSDRVTTANGRLYLDGVEIHNALTSQVIRFLNDGVDDWKPLVRFFENVQANPNEHSREQLFNWLDKRDFTITDSGLIVGYKGVQSDGKGGYESVHTGKAIVNGVVSSGHIPNPIGAMVEMPRDEVEWNPAIGCHRGLHVGTYEYAKTYSTRGVLLEVHVNPRDVVSVPTDCDWAKVRVCRYRVIRAIEDRYVAAYVTSDYSYVSSDWGEDDGCEDCGYDHYDCVC